MFGKNPPDTNFWVQIKNVTGLESPKAQKIEETIKRWYLEDVMLISDSINTTEELNTSTNTNDDRNTVMTCRFLPSEY